MSSEEGLHGFIVGFMVGMLGILCVEAVTPWVDSMVDQYRDNRALQVRAESIGLPLTATRHEIFYREALLDEAQKLGLSPTLTNEEIIAEHKRIDRQKLSEAANRLGLPATARWMDVQLEKERREDVARLGLPITATWDDIYTAQNMFHRRSAAEVFHLPPDATWAQISSAEAERQQQLALRIGLSPAATRDEIEAALKSRGTKND